MYVYSTIYSTMRTDTADYETLKRDLARGWNTWNTRSVLSHVLLPDGVAVNLGIKEYRDRSYLKESLIGRRGGRGKSSCPGCVLMTGGIPTWSCAGKR